MINNVVLVGRLTKDPDLKYTASSQAVATFTLAVNRPFTNQSGKREADFVQCIIWRKAAETLANYARKGTLLGVVGRIQTRNYENQQGQRVYVTEVVCDNFQLLESKQANEERTATTTVEQSQQNNQPTSNGQGSFLDKNNMYKEPDPFARSTQMDISDDDLPF